MTQEQIERYEVLREAKHDIEIVLDTMSKDEYYGFAVCARALLSQFTPDGFANKYITSKWVEDRLKCFFKTQLSEVNTLIEGL